MSITLPTLDELEAWWEAHPDDGALPNDANYCVIAIPMRATFGIAIEVQPHPDPREAEVLVYHQWPSYTHDATPLSPELNALALRFDAMKGDDEIDGTEHEDEDAYERRVNSERLVALIREMKEAK